MSLKARQAGEIPEQTREVAGLAFPKGNKYMKLRDELGELYQDEQFEGVYSDKGQPAEAPGRLALVTVLQFAEGLSDRQAAEAVRGRIDWKYMLGLELTDPGFDHSVLSEFRARLLKGQKEQELLNILLEKLKQQEVLKSWKRQRTDATYILGAIRELNRLEFVGESLRQALNELARVEPEWLREVIPADWFIRYGRRFDNIRLPKEQAKREQLSETIGTDGSYLLSVVYENLSEAQIQQLPGVELMRQIWLQQYFSEPQADGSSRVRLRQAGDQPPVAQRLQSPYDIQARYSAKDSFGWVGYKAYLTETCETETVHLITDVQTTSAPVADVTMTEPIQAALAQKELLPQQHLLDAGFIEAEGLVKAREELGVDICGPVKKDVHWQAQAGQGFDLTAFNLDWDNQKATCPEGHSSTGWSEQLNSYGQLTIMVKFKAKVCQACASRPLCTRSETGGRSLALRPQAEHLALHQRRQAQQTPEFWKTYAQRSGIEGTISQAIRACDLRRSRYIGLAKTHLQLIATATAINFQRLFDWFSEVTPASTRISPFAKLAPEPALLSTSWRF